MVYDYLTNPARQTEQSSLVLCHLYFIWLLSKLADEIRRPVQKIRSAILHIDILQYLTCESPFFAEYIDTARSSRESQEAISGSGIHPISQMSNVN